MITCNHKVVEVKRLQQTCKDLSQGNKKLLLASEMYSRVQENNEIK